MLFSVYCILTSFVQSPPRLPPMLRRTSFSDDKWELVSIDMNTATSILKEFSHTYDECILDPDFSCNPLIQTTLPQGALVLKKNDIAKMLISYVETPLGNTINVTHIAAPQDRDLQASMRFFSFVQESPRLSIDVERLRMTQPKWYLAYRHWYA